MGRDRTGEKPKRKRSPAPKLEPIGPLFRHLPPEKKALIVNALIGNLVTVVVEEYQEEMRKAKHHSEQGDTK